MTAVEVLALGLGALLVLAIFFHARVLIKVSREVTTQIHDKPVTSSVHTDMVGQLRRIAVATEKAANDRPAQIESRRIQDMNEVLVQGVIGVLDHDITHPEGLKDDVIIGREQSSEEFKARLKAALDAALKNTDS